MKKTLRNLILIFALICSQYNFSQNSTKTKTLETHDGKTIKLLPNNRILFEIIEKVNYLDSTNVISVTEDGKKICGLRISNVIHQSYGFYEYDGQNLVLTFQDENPIEEIEIQSFDKQLNVQKTIIRINKDYDTVYDLRVYQNDKELCQILSFCGNCEFEIDNTKSPLILKYNDNLKTVQLASDKNSKIIVSINDLKGNNQIKNEKLVYNINELTEK